MGTPPAGLVVRQQNAKLLFKWSFLVRSVGLIAGTFRRWRIQDFDWERGPKKFGWGQFRYNVKLNFRISKCQ